MSEETKDSELFITFSIKYTGLYEIPEMVGTAVEWDLHENYVTALQLSDLRVIAVTKTRPKKDAA
ncbi:MAG: hypothetical protein JWP74_3496 [Marmoricola sp.]|nr:hypothetical protein [Marmoricola sp.]